MPEEACFCLNCFRSVKPKPKNKSKFLLFLTRNRRALGITAGVLTVVLTLTAVLYRPNVQAPPKETPILENGTAAANTQEDTTHKGNIWESISNFFRPDEAETNPPSDTDITENDERSNLTLPNIPASDTSNTKSHENPTFPSDIPDSAPAEGFDTEQGDWEYATDSNSPNLIALTKYNGNAQRIVIPEKINGKYVGSLQRGAIKRISAATEIVFANGEFPYPVRMEDSCIQEMPNLLSVNFQNISPVVYGHFATDCCKLKSITVNDSQCRFENGALYCKTADGWEIRFYCPAATNADFSLPSWSIGFNTVCNLYENPYLKNIRLHSAAKRFPAQEKLGSALENIFVDNGNPIAISQNGVAFYKSGSSQYNISLYPPNSKNKVFTVPQNARLDLTYWNTVLCRNSRLEALYLPVGSNFFCMFDGKEFQVFPNIQKVYLQAGHSQSEEFNWFSGKVTLY